jgi:alpha,alpha-trehalose phosphorylase
MNSPPPTLEEATLMDLQDLEHNTRDRVHSASLASAWAVLVVGIGGMRDRDGVIGFMPRSPRDISGVGQRGRLADLGIFGRSEQGQVPAPDQLP